MDKKRTPITSFQSYELGGVYNVYEYLDENGEKKVDKVNSDKIMDLSIKFSRVNLEGITKKTDEGIKFCFERFSNPHSENDKIRYTNQFRHHIYTFINDYLKRKNKDIDNEETIDKVSGKLTNIIADFKNEHPNVDIKAVLEEICQNIDLENDFIIIQVLREQLNNLQNVELESEQQ